jgi:pSer/pThr/pTyr-binding forkhead associated (FHA) protein
MIGRHPGASLRLDSDTVSRRHCRISTEDGILQIEDLGSANGTLLNHSRVRGRALLEPTDSIQVGPYTFRARLLKPAALPRPSAHCSPDTITRVEAILSTDSPYGTGEQPLDLGEQLFDHRLYEEAIRRTTGGETPRNVIPLKAALRSPEPEAREEESDTATTNGPGLIPADIAEQIDSRVRPITETVSDEPKTSRNVLASEESFADEELDWCDSVVELVPDLSEMSSSAFESYLASELNRPAGQSTSRADTLGDRPSLVGAAEGETVDDATAADRVRCAVEVVPSTEMRDPVLRSQVSLAAPNQEGPSAFFDEGPSGPTCDFDDEARDGRLGVLARLVTPSARETARELEGLFYEEVDETVEVPVCVNNFAAIEISARAGERVVQACTLSRPGDQYVLGHETPQGGRIPWRAHRGLRLLRINQDREVDLVFPGNVGGHLVRDGTTVALHELTEGRKYSCLRLKPRDIATIILGDGPNVISYHIRFTHAPAFALRTS